MGAALGALFLPFVSALLMPVLYRPLGRRLGWVALAAALATFALVVLTPLGLSQVLEWVPQLGINLSIQVDGWSKQLAYLVSGIGALVFLYSILYLGKREDLGKFYMYILLFMGAMMGVVYSGNLMTIYVFWELTSITSFLLIGFWYTRESGQYGALKSLLLTVSGGLAMLGGITILGYIGGTYELTGLIANKAAILAHPLSTPALLLMLWGAFSKSAQVPFHIWLPDAMSAPTPVSAYLHSATMVKAGLFVVARMWPIFVEHPYWTPVVATVGLITMTMGGYLALQKTDLKAILAMSTISQLGLIMSLFGFGTADAAAAGVLHLLNHGIFKGLLFMVVGIIDHETGTRDIRKLSGLRHAMPITFVLACIGAASMAGIPPLSGFISKEMFLAASLESPFGLMAAVVSTLASVLTTTYSLILAHKIWFGPKPQELATEPHEAPFLMWAPPTILAALVIAIGLAPDIVEYSIIQPAYAAVTGGAAEPMAHLALWHGWNSPALYMSSIAIGGGVIAYTQLPKLVTLFRRWTPERYNANNLYDWLWWKGAVVEKLAKRITDAQMTGLLRDYLVYTLGSAVALFLTTLWMKGIRVGELNLAPIDPHEWILLGVIATGALAVMLAKTRLAAMAAVGMVGIPLSLLFAFLQAPDLALTQLAVEVVSTVLFLLAFAHLPQLKVYPRTALFQDINVIVAIGVGFMAAMVTLLATTYRRFEPDIAEYYVANSYKEGGGRNVVNVTLVDFRGFDTLFEIVVLTIAGLAIFSLIRLRVKGGRAQ